MFERTVPLLLLACTTALAAPREDLDTASNAALQEAARRSRDGKYAEAATLVREVETKFRAILPPADHYKLGTLAKAALVYGARAEAQRNLGTDPKAARALLNSLLDSGRYDIETAAPDDKRVAAVLEHLRQTDAKAKRFFTPRAVRVVVSGDALSPTDAATLVEGVVPPLRALGFLASAKEGAETLTLDVKLGGVIKDLAKEGGILASALPATSESCELKVDATWAAGEAPLIRIDLSKRGLGFSDLQGQCVKARIKEIPALVAPRLVKRWDSDYAP